jgi:hypothetical protein
MLYKNTQKATQTLLNKIKKLSKSLVISLVLVGSILTGIAALQVSPNLVSDTLGNLGNNPKVSATPVCTPSFGGTAFFDTNDNLCHEDNLPLVPNRRCSSLADIPDANGTCFYESLPIFDCATNVQGQSTIFSASGYNYCSKTPQYFTVKSCAMPFREAGYFVKAQSLNWVLNYENQTTWYGTNARDVADYSWCQYNLNAEATYFGGTCPAEYTLLPGVDDGTGGITPDFCTPTIPIRPDDSGCPPNYRVVMDQGSEYHRQGTYNYFLCGDKSFLDGTTINGNPVSNIFRMLHTNLGRNTGLGDCASNYGSGFSQIGGDLTGFGSQESTILCSQTSYQASVPGCPVGQSYYQPGNFCFRTFAATSFSCPPSQYLTTQGTDSCTTCPAGSSCGGGVGAVATPCTPGTYSATAGATSCTQCPPNQYCGDGVSTPSSCPPNTSAPAGSDALVDCMLNQVILHLKAMLSGAFDATSITASNPTGNMTNALDTRNLLPVSQPYNIPGVLYTGTETLPTTNLSPNITDWVLVEVRDGTTANNGIGNLLTSKAVVMLSDGTIKDSSTATAGDLTNNITLTNLTVNTNYKIILRHRNHLAIATNPTVGFDNSGQATLDFTNNFNIIAANQKQVGMSLENTPRTLFALRATDASGDGQIDAIDRNELITSDEYDGTYSNKDLNLDGGIDASDRNLSQNTGEATTNL